MKTIEDVIKECGFDIKEAAVANLTDEEIKNHFVGETNLPAMNSLTWGEIAAYAIGMVRIHRMSLVG